MVRHSGHGVRALTTVNLTFHVGAALAHQCAHTGRAQNPGQKDAQEKYRSCSFRCHSGKCTLRQMRCANSLAEKREMRAALAAAVATKDFRHANGSFHDSSNALVESICPRLPTRSSARLHHPRAGLLHSSPRRVGCTQTSPSQQLPLAWRSVSAGALEFAFNRPTGGDGR
jgi:hypothetical protein